MELRITDLIPIDIGKVVLVRGGNAVRVWTSAQKGNDTRILFNNSQYEWGLVDPREGARVASTFYVEGCSLGNSRIRAQMRDYYGQIVAEDFIWFTFIAATCGRQPQPDEGDFFAASFPSLTHCEWSVTGQATAAYNCIAWSVGETDVWYNQRRSDPQRGIVSIDDEYGDRDGEFEISDLDAFYSAKGFVTTNSIEEANVIYYSGFHAAGRKNCSCGSGRWVMFESKCGSSLRIEHRRDQLNGEAYGQVVRFYKRK